MSDSAMNSYFELVEIYGKPAMFSNERIDRCTVPDGWHCYDLRGSDNEPSEPATVEQFVSFHHAGSVLLPTPIIFRSGQKNRSLVENREYALSFLGEDVTMADFCERYGLPMPENPQKFPLRPAMKEEISFFYAADHETDLKNGNIGYVRMDFGRGEEFWHTWWPRGLEEWNSQEFKEELEGLDGNRHYGDCILAGPFFVCGDAGENFRSLTDEEVTTYMARFAEPEEISQEEVKADMGFTIISF